MAFKVPLPKVFENRNQSKSSENQIGSQISLPSFKKTDLLNLSLIGQGAFGKVFKCTKDGVTYVMKQMVDVNPDNSEVRLFLKEAGLLNTLKGHENVVQIHGFSHHYNAMLLEYVHFSFACLNINHEVVSTLKEMLDACDTLSNFSGFEHMQQHIATDVAEALRFLHSRNVAHRDLKPANVLVSNSHYAASADVTSFWSVRPIIAKLSDFGESRSSLLQTNSLVQTSTRRLNRGSPAYIAPEAFGGGDFKAHLQNLFAMDVWSFAMTLFQVLNPNIRHPYAVEMDTKNIDMDSLEMLKQLHHMKALPKNDGKYSQYQKTVWLPLVNVYLKCAQFSAVDRPLAKDIVQLLVNEYVVVHPLVLRQPVLVVDHEVQVRFKPEQVILHESAYSVLNLLTDQSTAYDAYNILQSSQLSATHDILFPMFSLNPKTAAEAKQELCLCLSSILADDNFHCAVYTLMPYSFLICKDSKGKAVLVQLPDDVTRSDGLCTVVSSLREDTTIPAICNWLFNKLEFSCDVCYKLALLKPLKETSVESSACEVVSVTNLHMECSTSPVNILEEDNSDMEQDCGASVILQNRSNNRWGTSENSISSTSPVNILEEDNSDMEQDCGASVILQNRSNNRWGTSENSISKWQMCNEELVEKLPHDINGLKKYRLCCNVKRKDQVMKITKDGRPWKLWNTSSRKGFTGVRRIARCKGSFTCTLASCSFALEHGKPNKVHFRKQPDGTDCFVCGLPAENVPCPGVKIWEFDKSCSEVVVYHQGDHTCDVKKRKFLSNAAIVEAVRRNPSVKPSRLVQQEMVSLMSAEEFIWTDIETVADNLADLKRVQYERQQVKQIMNPCGESFEALAFFKKKCMEKDKFFIYKINDRALNGLPSFVFKSSTSMAQLAINMDRDGAGILKNEYAHVDAKHDRCRGFKSVTLWTYHPVMRKLVRLAVMDVEQENCESLTSFWSLFNEMLQDVSGNSEYKFNPSGFVADEHHANWTSVRNVFGANVVNRMVSCEFHYKQSVQRHAKHLQPSGASEFICLAEKMLTALTISDFNEACQSMHMFIKDHECVKDWYDWWHKRRMHIFRAFKGDDVPRSNLAEVGHAKMASIGRPYMSLLEVAKEDVASAIRQESELRLFPEGVATGGRGMNLKQKMARHYKANMNRAKGFAKEIHLQSSLSRPPFYVPTSGVHRPPNSRKKSCLKQKTAVKASHPVASQGSAPAAPTGAGKQKQCNTPSVQNASFQLVFFNGVRGLKKCYGCSKLFAAKHRKIPNDLILQHYCHRRYQNNEGIHVMSKKLQSAYCHLNLNCARMIRPEMELSDIIIHDEVRNLLTAKHEAILSKFGI